jgi:hypothetical protein
MIGGWFNLLYRRSVIGAVYSNDRDLGTVGDEQDGRVAYSPRTV